MEFPNLELLAYKFSKRVAEKAPEVKYPSVEVFAVFSQTWSDTSLGFGGWGGQAITSAYTTVLSESVTGACAVFFGGKMAYIIHPPNDAFFEDVKARNMEPCSGVMKYRSGRAEV